jgi:hypothetical protein
MSREKSSPLWLQWHFFFNSQPLSLPKDPSAYHAGNDMPGLVDRAITQDQFPPKEQHFIL